MGSEGSEAHLLWYAPAPSKPRVHPLQREKLLNWRLGTSSGKILKDEETVESYKIEEKGYVVCMINKVSLPNHESLSSAVAGEDQRWALTRMPGIQQPRAAPAAGPSTPAQQTASASSAPSAPPAAAQPAAARQPTTAAAPPDTPTPAGAGAVSERNFNDPNALTMGAQRTEAIANMEAMGFERAQIEAAMRAAFNNPDRAVEYLLNVC